MGGLAADLRPVSTTLYVDLTLSQVQKHAELLNSLPVDGLAIMVQNSKGRFTYTGTQCAELPALFPQKRLSLVGWPRTLRAREDAEGLKARCLDAGGATPELDLEGNFKGTLAQRTEAARVIREVFGDGNYTTTTFPYHTENTIGAVLSPYGSLHNVQTYGTSTRGGKPVGLTDPLGPARIHELRHANPSVPLSLAFPLYGQNFKGATPEETLSVQVSRGLVAHRPVDIRVWSAKQLIRESNTYALPFLRDTYPKILGEYREWLLLKWASWLLHSAL